MKAAWSKPGSLDRRKGVRFFFIAEYEGKGEFQKRGYDANRPPPHRSQQFLSGNPTSTKKRKGNAVAILMMGTPTFLRHSPQRCPAYYRGITPFFTHLPDPKSIPRGWD
jgi:hypothetical protein